MRIRDPIHGTIVLSNQEQEIVDNPYYQRLRHIRQIGFGELAFPGGTHTRHAHALGAMHVASKLFDAATANAQIAPASTTRFRAAVRLAVLCHDLGHMPLSHSSERIAPQRSTLKLPAWLTQPESTHASAHSDRATHEDFTARIILDSSLTELINRLYQPVGVTAEHIVGLIAGRSPSTEFEFHEAGLDWTPLLRAIVSGELDADRMDYLLRDSFYTGVNYGRFDLEWILLNVQVVERSGQMVMALSKAAVFAFEDFLLSRYHMFLSVYYHHTSVSFDWMLQRYYEEASGEFEIPADPEAFLRCDDVALYVALRSSSNRWAKRIVARQGFRRVAQFTERDLAYDLNELSHALTAANIEHFAVESLGILSKYFTEGETPALYVVDPSNGRLTEIAKYTPLFERFSGAVHLSRVYVRPDQADIALPLVASLTRDL